MPKTGEYDLAIAGAGPAGSVLALLCARRGLRVLLAERSRFDRRRVGETVSPEIKALFTQLELGTVFERFGHREAPGSVSVWGSFEPAERSHINSPFGNALHLDRRAFDEALAHAARAAGADLHMATSIRFEPRPRGGYHVITNRGERTGARIAVLASGRSSRGNGLAYVRSHLDDHAAVVGWIARQDSAHEHRTVVEAVPGGWFYLAQLSDDCMAVVFVACAKSVPPERIERQRWWLDMLARTRVVRSALRSCQFPLELTVCDARASFAAVPAGADWIAIGDARLAPDPLSGRGIVWAIEDAIFAAQSIAEAGADGLASIMMERTRRDVDQYRVMRDYVYGQERRFPDDAYWKSRLSDSFRASLPA